MAEHQMKPSERTNRWGDLAAVELRLWAPGAKVCHLQGDRPGKTLCGRWALSHGFRLLSPSLYLSIPLCRRCERIAS
jgi:hypothetical protein